MVLSTLIKSIPNSIMPTDIHKYVFFDFLGLLIILLEKSESNISFFISKHIRPFHCFYFFLLFTLTEIIKCFSSTLLAIFFTLWTRGITIFNFDRTTNLWIGFGEWKIWLYAHKASTAFVMFGCWVGMLDFETSPTHKKFSIAFAAKLRYNIQIKKYKHKTS